MHADFYYKLIDRLLAQNLKSKSNDLVPNYKHYKLLEQLFFCSILCVCARACHSFFIWTHVCILVCVCVWVCMHVWVCWRTPACVCEEREMREVGWGIIHLWCVERRLSSTLLLCRLNTGYNMNNVYMQILCNLCKLYSKFVISEPPVFRDRSERSDCHSVQIPCARLAARCMKWDSNPRPICWVAWSQPP